MRIDFGHGLRLVRHPEIVYVLQTALTAEPCLTESFEGVPAHSFLIQTHLREAMLKPAIFQISIHVLCHLLSGIADRLSRPGNIAGTLRRPGVNQPVTWK